MRTRTSVTANKALMNSERYRIIAARHAFAAARVVAYVWLTEYGYRYTAYSLHMRIRRLARCIRLCVMHTYAYPSDMDITVQMRYKDASPV